MEVFQTKAVQGVQVNKRQFSFIFARLLQVIFRSSIPQESFSGSQRIKKRLRRGSQEFVSKVSIVVT
jgi:hypothetical protein